MVVPVPPTMFNLGYFRRAFLNVPKSLVLVALTLMANLAISRISGAFVSPDSATGKFVKDVTGVDTSSWGGTWETIKGSFAAYTKWSTWIKLLLPPLPFPGSQGSAAIGSPNVTVNGGALAFANAPLMAASCSDVPIVPNAMIIGSSNVMVGVSVADMIRGIAVHAAQGAVSAGVAAGVDRLGSNNKPGKDDCGCD
jgi:hypothetical protein